MVKNNLILVGLSLLAVSNSSFSMQFTSTINKLKLPLLMSVEQPPAIKYADPGEMNVSARRMCGDGDVAHFKEQNPNFEFVPSEQEKLDVIIGYWVVEKGSTDKNPTKDNWFPIAYSSVKIEKSQTASSDIAQFNLFNNKNKQGKSLELFRKELSSLYEVSQKSYLTQGKEYETYAAVISCVDPDGKEFMNGEAFPSPLDIITSLDNMSASSFNENTSHIKIKQKEKGYDFTFENDGIALKGPLFETFKNIIQIPHPADLDDYKVKTSGLKTLLANSADPIGFCNSLGVRSDKSKNLYSYELFPMNLTCKNLYKDDELKDAYQKFMNPAELPDSNTFNALKNKLAQRFLIAAGLEVAQEEISKTAQIIRTGCFPRGPQKPIERIVASYPLRFIKKGAPNNVTYELKPNNYNHIHPESLFAINDYLQYFQNPSYAIWGQVEFNKSESRPYPIILELGSDKGNPIPSSFSDTKLNINFKVRSVGGSCNGTIYC